MRVVVDANIVAAALIRPDGWTARQLHREDVTWLLPVFLKEELQAHAGTFAETAGIDRQRWDRRVERLLTRLKILDDSALVQADGHPWVERACEIDPDDAVYLATAVAGDADLLWTRDGALLDAFGGLAVRVVPEGVNEGDEA